MQPHTATAPAPETSSTDFAPAPGDSDGVEPQLLGYLFDDRDLLNRCDDAAPAPTLPATVPPDPVGRRVGSALVESRLAGMGDANVRSMLARKLCRLLPDLPPDGRDTVTSVVLRALEQLARDHVTHVRAALSSAVKDVACAPPAIVRALARDVEPSVAEPILHYCATLTDDDLLAIIAGHPAAWALAAIAGRGTVSGPVSSAILGTGDTAATGVLLDNTGAVIPDESLEGLVERSIGHPDWQAKLAARPALPRHLAVRLAAVVDGSIMDLLHGRPDFDAGTVAEVAEVMRRRVAWVETRDPTEPPERRAVRLHRQGALDETAFGDALSWNEAPFVRAALALRANVHRSVVDDVLASGNARAVTALVWRAGFSMRCAMRVQTRAGGIAPRDVLNARGGTDYPLSPAEMTRLLGLYGVRA